MTSAELAISKSTLSRQLRAKHCSRPCTNVIATLMSYIRALFPHNISSRTHYCCCSCTSCMMTIFCIAKQETATFHLLPVPSCTMLQIRPEATLTTNLASDARVVSKFPDADLPPIFAAFGKKEMRYAQGEKNLYYHITNTCL